MKSFAGREALVEEIREKSRCLLETLCAACDEARLRYSLHQFPVELEHRAYDLFNDGNLLASRVAPYPGHEEHQDRCGIARIVDRAQWRCLLPLPRGSPTGSFLAA